MVVLIKQLAVNKLGYTFLCKIRIDSPRAVAQKGCKMVNIARLGAFEYNRNGSTFFGAD